MSDSTDADARRRLKPDEKTLSPLSLLLLDQQERWQRGECPSAESYLDKHPSLRDQLDHLMTLIYHEIVLRERRGERPTPAEYEQRFPQWAEDIRQHFEIHAALSMASPYTPQEPTPGTPSSPPGYEILGVLGRGGTAVVYKARHLALNRIVALKMIIGGDHAGPEERARFRTEAQAIASLKHPNIVQIYEVIEHDGRLFLALEFVDGGSLAKYVRGTPVSATVAVNLLEPLARAMHFVHQQGILHRDLKPANVLLQIAHHQAAANELQSAIPKITDFGLAKLLSEEGQSPTRTGDVLGTPSYMAPEQIEGPRHRVGPSTDVYGLGAILYELLTGRPPFVGDTALVTLQQVRDNDPISPTQLQPGCPRDLTTIVLKCLEKSPSKRYVDAAALADDLSRFREGRAITARPVSNSEQIVKWARRRPAIATLVSMVAVLVIGGGALVTYLWLATANALEDTKTARDRLDLALKVAKDANAKAVLALDEVEKSRATIAKALDDTQKAHEKTAKALTDAEDARQKTADTLAEKLLTLAQYDFSQNKIDDVRKHLAAIPKSYRGKDWRYLDRHVNAERAHLATEGRVTTILFSPDSKHLAFRTQGEKGGFVWIWDHAANRIVFKREGPDNAIDIFFDPANKSIGFMGLIGESPLEKKVFVQRIPLDGSAPGPQILSRPGNHYPRLYPESRYIVSTILDKLGRAELFIWNLDTGKFHQREVKGLNSSALISHDGRYLALMSSLRPGADWTCQLINLHKDTVERELTGKYSGVLSFTPDFRSYVTTVHLGGGVGKTTVSLFDADTGVKKWEYKRPIGTLMPRYSHDSRWLGIGTADKRILVLDTRTGDEFLALRGHQGGISALAFSPDGRWLASADGQNGIKIWAMDDSEK